MPALSNKDRKRLSDYGFSREVEEAVADIWSRSFGKGIIGEATSFAVIALALSPLFFGRFPGLNLEGAYTGLAGGFCIAFALLGATMLSLVFEQGRNAVDSDEHRKLYLSRNVLSHVFAKGWRKRLGPIAAGLMTCSLVLSGHWAMALGFAACAFALSVGTTVVEVLTKSFLKDLEKKLCFAEVWETRSREPFKGETIEGECVRIA